MTTPALIVEDVYKTFHVPKQHVSTLKEKALHPFRRTETLDFEVLKGISFEIGHGEFFGIVGKNGSGKSTLLKCLAGIYRADSGQISAAGRVAPFIELGVGFNMDLTAYDNVVINGVMMGLTQRQAKESFEAVMEFAELEDFKDLKLKNYSSGMQVRLAFAVMVQSDADVFLIDEVLAVGDAAFQQKCLDVFHKLRDAGKTIVLVTHDMTAVERFCHRAMFIRDGVIEMIGDPLAVGGAYIDANFEKQIVATLEEGTAGPQLDAWDAKVRPINADGEQIATLRSGKPITLRVELTPPVEVEYPELFIVLRDPIHRQVTGTMIDFGRKPLLVGERVELDITFETELAEAVYDIGLHLHRAGGPEPVVEDSSAGQLIVHGAQRVVGAMKVPTEVKLLRGGVPQSQADTVPAALPVGDVDA